MNIKVVDGFPYTSIEISYRGSTISIDNILIDTGSGGTIISADCVSEIGVLYQPNDPVYKIRGIGGSEFVFVKRADVMKIGPLEVRDFEIEVGAVDYGFNIQGIVGMDFLLAVGAIIDLDRSELFSRRFPDR